MINPEFSSYIKKRRQELGFSVRALAEKCSINYTRLSKIENNLRPVPDVNSLVLLAQALDLEPDFLISKAGIVKDGALSYISGKSLNRIYAKIIEKSDGLASMKGEAGHFFSAVTPVDSGSVVIELPPENISLFIDDTDIVTSTRNRIHGSVCAIEHGEGASVITIDSNGLTLNVLVTNRSIESMGLKEGSQVVARFKAAAVRVTSL